MLPWRRITAFSGIALLGLFAAAFVACTGQGENERCNQLRGGEDPSTGPSDCQDGLVCVLSSQLGQNADVCCPKDVTQRTGICAGKGTTGGDSGTDTATADTGADTATADSGADAAKADAADSATADTATADTASGDAADSAAPDSSDAADASDAG